MSGEFISNHLGHCRHDARPGELYFAALRERLFHRHGCRFGQRGGRFSIMSRKASMHRGARAMGIDLDEQLSDRIAT